MYAVVDIAGQQFRIEKDNKLLINRIKGEVGEKVNFSKVLFIDNDGKVKIGSPYIKDATVTVKILSHIKGDKVKVFKKKRRKGYKVLNGFRPYLTEVLIEDISETKAAQKTAPAKEAVKATENKKDVKKVEAATAKETPKKAAAAKTPGKPAATAKKAGTEKAKTTVRKTAAKASGPKTGTKKETTAKSTGKATKSQKKPGK